MHGAGTEAARAKSAEIQAQAAADQALSRLLLYNADAPPIRDSVSAMQRLAGIVGHAVDYVGRQLSGPVCEYCGRSAQPLDSSTGQMWMRAIREQRGLLEAMERLGIATRYLAFQEQQVRRVAVAYDGSFDIAFTEVPELREALTPEVREVLVKGFVQLLRDSEDPGPATVVGEVAS